MTKRKPRLFNATLLLTILIVSALGIWVAWLLFPAQRTTISGGLQGPSRNLALASANGMRILSDDEFVLVRHEMDNPTAEWVRATITIKNGLNYVLESNKGASIFLLEANARVTTYVSTNHDLALLRPEELLDAGSERIDPAIAEKLSSSPTVRVIIQLNLGFHGFYRLEDDSPQRLAKQMRFQEVKEQVSSLLRGGGRVIGDSQIIGGVLAEVNRAGLFQINNSPLVMRVVLDRLVKIFDDEALAEIGAMEVWPLLDATNNPLTGMGQRIAIIDTGVDYTHPDLGGCLGPQCKVLAGWDFLFNDNDPMDDNGHGTHVAATAAGKGLENGVAPDASIVAYKVCDASGACPWSAILSAIDYATDPNRDGDPSDHVDVASMSLGGDGNPDDLLSQAVDRSTEAGVVFTIAAGNSGPTSSTIKSPGTARGAITVAAACEASQIGLVDSCQYPIAAFSSQGPLIWNGVDIQKPDIAAPGVLICAARWDSAYPRASTCTDNRHVRISGTSMATPHAAGAAALIRQAFPGYTPGQVKQVLKSTARNLGMSYDAHGAGMIDLEAAIPISPKLSISPSPWWKITTDPTQKISLSQQRFDVTPIESGISTPTLSFSASTTGIQISSDKSVLQLGNGSTDSFLASLTVDNDLVSAGPYAASIFLSEGGVTKGVILIFIAATPTLITSPLAMQIIDYGIDDPNLSSWMSGLRQVSVTNLRSDTSQTAIISNSAYPTGVTFQSPLSSTIPAGGTVIVDTRFVVDNSRVPNGIYRGTLDLENSANSIRLNTKFVKFYALVIQDPDAADFFQAFGIVHDSVDQRFVFSVRTMDGQMSIFIDKLGTYDLVLEYLPKYDATGYHRYAVFKEGISVTNATTYVNVSRNSATHLTKTSAVDSNGTPISQLVSNAWREVYLPNPSILTLGGWTSNVNDASENYFSDVSQNYQYEVYYNWPSYQAATGFHFYYGAFTGLYNDVSFSNTAADFRKMDLHYDPEQRTGTALPVVYACNLGQTCWAFVDPAKTLTVPVRQTIYSLIPPDANYHFFRYRENVTSPYFTVAATSERWFDPSTKLPPIQDNTVYAGLGPSYWSTRLQNSPDIIRFLPYNDGSPNAAFLRQDYALADYEGIPYFLYRDNVQVASGFFPAFLLSKQQFWVEYAGSPLGSIGPGQPGRYELRVDFPYQEQGISLVGKVVAVFDTSLSDPNPPAFKRLHYFANYARSELYDPNVPNRLEFELDPVGGMIGQVSASYSTNGNDFTALNLVQGASGYFADLPSVANLSKMTLRITSVDNSQNQLSYAFELPAGNAPSGGTPPPEGKPPGDTGTDTTPPSILIGQPPDGIILPNIDSVKISATASDPSGVRRIEVLFDGTSVQVCYDTFSCEASVPWSGALYGSHTIEVLATDRALTPNTGRASVTFVSTALYVLFVLSFVFGGVLALMSRRRRDITRQTAVPVLDSFGSLDAHQIPVIVDAIREGFETVETDFHRVGHRRRLHEP